MNRIWEKMAGQYGSNWGNNFGHAPNEEWTEAIIQRPEWVVGEALKDCFNRDTKWPPMLPEFVALCGRIPAYRNPAIQKAAQIEYKQCNSEYPNSGPKSPGGRAYTDLIASGIQPGEPGYKEYYAERHEHHKAKKHEA